MPIRCFVTVLSDEMDVVRRISVSQSMKSMRSVYFVEVQDRLNQSIFSVQLANSSTCTLTAWFHKGCGNAVNWLTNNHRASITLTESSLLESGRIQVIVLIAKEGIGSHQWQLLKFRGSFSTTGIVRLSGDTAPSTLWVCSGSMRLFGKHLSNRPSTRTIRR